MRVFKKALVVSLSLAAFVFVLPFELIQGVAKRFAGRGSSVVKIVSEAYADVFYTVEEAVSTLLCGVDTKEEIRTLTSQQQKAIETAAKVEFDPEFDKEFHFYTSSTCTAILHSVKGKWGPIKFMMALEPDGKIKDLLVLELTERRGKPVKERKFLDQYKGKSALDPVKLNKDVKGIAGATISSRQMTDGIRKLLYVYQELYRK